MLVVVAKNKGREVGMKKKKRRKRKGGREEGWKERREIYNMKIV